MDETVADRPELAVQLAEEAGPAHLVSLRRRGKVAWVCPRGADHRWEASPYNRGMLGHGCPYCAGKRPSAGRNLAVLHPAVAAELDATLNDGLRAEELLPGSHAQVWWRCATNPEHVWQAPVHTRTKTKPRPAGCPWCSGNRLDPLLRSLAVTHPRVAAELDVDRNQGLDPGQVSYGSKRVVWWRCPAGPDHRWQAAVCARTSASNPTGCPCCSGYQLSVTNSLAARHPELDAELDPALNDGLSPEHVLAGTRQVVTWRCPEGPDHIWDSPVVHRTATGNGCPFYAGRRASVTNRLSLYHAVAAQFDLGRNAPLTPDRISGRSTSKVWWACPKGPDHRWQATPSVRTAAGSGCPYCAGHLVSVTNALATRAPDVSAELDPSLNDGLTPWQVTASSSRNITWRCRQNPLHTWTTCVSARTGPSRSGCPHCSLYRVSRRQLALGFELRALLPDTEPTGTKLTAGGRRWEADIFIPAHRVVVEFDGRYWHARPGAADRDRRKSEAIRGAGYTLIRVREEPLPVLHPHDVCVPAGDTKAAVVAVLNRIVEITGRPIPAADTYAATPGLLAEAAFHAHVDAALRDDSADTLW
ncbi:zinc-ribbon domain-containing protein [Streptomyces sp. NBC_01550]|uniref:zinc-ribbon domain-containing protein n=1 Tax=Streptomyces sp. NBC_01550 TaxID=2975875 RepID=UPI0038701767